MIGIASSLDDVTGVAIDAQDGIYLTGNTFSFDFPTTPSAFQTVQSGGSRDVFVMRFDPTGSTLAYSTLLGGFGNDEAQAIDVDASGMATVSGYGSSLMTATPGAFDLLNGRDIFITRLNPSGSRRIYSTFLGGDAEDFGWDMAMDRTGRVVVCGSTSDADYPTTPGSAQPVFNGGQFDALVSVLDLNPIGVSAIGTSTPACHGPLQIQASQMPSAGATDFALICSAAAPNASGWLILSSAPGTGTTTLGGATLWVDTHLRLLRFPVSANAAGYAEVRVPRHVMTPGRHFYAQYVLSGTPSCSVPGMWLTTPGLEIVVQ